MRTSTVGLLLTAVAATALAAGPAPPPRTAAEDFVALGPVEALPSPIEQALATLRADALRAHIAFLASPALEGRGLGSPGLDAAAEYLAASLALAGIPPLPGGTGDTGTEAYFQQVPLREVSAVSGEVAVERQDGAVAHRRAFASGVDAMFSESVPGSVTAPAVFAGYGIREPALGRDDYRGLDVAGRIVVVLGGLPPDPAWHTAELEARYGADKLRERYEAKLASAAAAHAVAVLAIEPTEIIAAAVKDDAVGEQFFLPFEQTASEKKLPLVRISTTAAESLLGTSTAGDTKPGADRPRPLPGVTVTITTGGKERLVRGRNVLAVLAGSDPTLRGEAIVLGAHMDHLGRRGDVINPGADDNASGVAALLEIAKALAASPKKPRRTVVFAFWTGEEDGKLGSGHWVRHPLWPLERTKAYLNLDMIGHRWSLEEIRALVNDSGCGCGDVFLAGLDPSLFVEPGLADWAPELEAVLRRAARGLGLALHLDRSSGRHGGSDYRDFARAGLPFVRFFGNFFPGYHDAADTPERLDATAVQQQAQLCLTTAWLLADR